MKCLAAPPVVITVCGGRRGGNGQIATQAAIDVEFRDPAVGSVTDHRQSADWTVLDMRGSVVRIHDA